jgi:uncharacterized membrane protein
MDEIVLGLIGLLCSAVVLLLPSVMTLFVLPARLRALERRIAQLEQEAASREGIASFARPQVRPNTVTPTAPQRVEPLPEPTPSPGPEAQPTPEPIVAEPIVAEPIVAEEVPAPPPPFEPIAPAARPASPLTPERMAVLLGGGIGALLVLMGAFLGLKAVAERGLLSPGVRIGAALIAGTAMWAGAAALRRNTPWLGAALAGTGAGVLYGTVFAATTLYGFLDPSTSFALTTVITAVAALHAVRTGEPMMASMALIGGLAAPVVLSTGENRPIPFFAYLGLLSAGMLVIAALRRWPALVFATGAGVGLEFLGWTASWYRPDQAAVGMAGAWFLALPFTLMLLRSGPKTGALHLTTLGTATVLSLLAVPWLMPIDLVQFDPVSNEQLPPHPGVTLWWAAAMTGLLGAPLWLVGRWRDDQASASAAALVALVGTTTFSSWGAHPEGHTLPIAAGLIGALLLGTALTWGHNTRTSLALQPLLAGFGLAFAVVQLGTAEPVFGLSVIALAALGALPGHGLVRQTTTLLGVAIAAAALTAVAAGDGLVSWAFAPAAASLILLGHVPVWRQRRGEPGPDAVLAAVATVLLYPAFHLTWKETLGPDAIGAVPALLAAQAVLAFALLMRRSRPKPESLVVGVWVVVVLAGLTAALPLQLSQQWLTLGLALEGAALAWISNRARHPVVWWSAVLAGCAAAVRLLVNPEALSYGDTTGWPLFNWTLYTWGVPALCLLLSAAWLRRALPTEADRARQAMPGFVLLLGLLCGFALVNVEISHAFHDRGPLVLTDDGWVEGMVRSLSWAGYGMALLGFGLWRRVRVMRLLGFGFLMLGAMKVFLVDLWSLSGFARVGSLLGLGGSLLLAAWLFERLDLRGETTPEDR